MNDNKERTTWRVTRFAEKIQSGDLAFIWKTGNERGKYPVMVIEENPREMEEVKHENRYNIPSDFSLKVQVENSFKKHISGISASLHKKTKGLDQLSGFHCFKQGTNYKVSEEEVRIIMRLVDSVNQ